MLEEIRIYVMRRLHNLKLKGEGWNLNICPSIRLKLEKMKEKQRYWSVESSGYQQFEVRLGVRNAYAVDLINRTCGCRSWQLTGIPCMHGVACISYLNRDCEAYVSEWFTTAKYHSCYKYTIKPCNGSDEWPETDYIKPLPPKKRRLPGRPKLKRRMDESERQERHTVSKRGASLKCSICKLSGHNKTKCPKRPDAGTSTATVKCSICGFHGHNKARCLERPKNDDVASTSGVKKNPKSKSKRVKTDVEPDMEPDLELDLEPDVEPDVEPVVIRDDEPVVEAPVVDAPVVDEAVVDAPVVDAAVEDAPVVARKRKPSERITKLKLTKNWVGEGTTEDNPFQI